MIRVLDEEKINRIIDAMLALQEQEDVTIPALWRQLIETEKGIGNIVNAIQQGILTASTKWSDIISLQNAKNCEVV